MTEVIDKKWLPNWVRKEELELAEDAMFKHEGLAFIKMLLTWDDHLLLKESHPEMKVFEQKHGYAFVEVCMTEFEHFDFMAWRYMDKRARAMRECRYCGNEIPRRNLAYCSREHMERAMRGEYGTQFKS